MCKGFMKQLPLVSQDYCSVPEMTSSFGDDLEKELNGLLESREYNLSCRLKVYFLGDRNAGKTSLVKSLIGENASLADKPSEGTSNYIWRPFRDNNSLLQRRPSLDERNLTLDLWDLTGRKVCQGIHQMFLSKALYVLVFNLVNSDSCQQLPKYMSYVQAKIPGCPLLVVATRADKLFTANERIQKAEETLAGVRAAQQAEVDAIKNDITQISDLGADPKLLAQIEWLEGLLQNRPKLRAPIQVVSCKTGKGLSELRRQLVNMALDCELFPHTGQLLKPEQLRLCELIDQAQAMGKLLVTWAEYRELASEANMAEANIVIHEEKNDPLTDAELLKNITFLEHVGLVNSMHGPKTARGKDNIPLYICINSKTLAKILCCCHVDNPRKTFRIEGRRFWPEGQTPDPANLVKFLEEIPHQGVIREVLLPLLWQDSTLDEEQVLRILDLLTTLGLFTSQTLTLGDTVEPSTENQTRLILQQFDNLSQNRKYYANLIGLVPDKRPLLNWSPKPFKGDVQVNWRYSFPCGTPPGLTQRMLGACRAAAVNDFYKHQWRYGLLVKFDDAVVCVEVDTVDLYVDVSCRVNADDPLEEDEAVQFLWAHLAPFIRATGDLLSQWPGLVYKLELIPFGPLFHGGETMGGEHAYPLCQCFMSARTDTPITFTEGGVERALHGHTLLQMDGNEHSTLDDWLADILSRRQAVIEKRSVTPLSPPPKPPQRKEDIDGAPLPQKTKKKLEIKWDLADEDAMKNKPVTSADTGNNNKTGDKKNSRDEANSDKDSNSAANSKSSDDEKSKAGGMFLTEEQQTQEAMRVASGFVASLLAQAVADYVQAVHEDNHAGMGKEVVTKAQVEAARRTALAAVAAQTGEIDTTAKAVMDAAKSLRQASPSDKNTAQSKTCVIL